jgi:hypothetical protein
MKNRDASFCLEQGSQGCTLIVSPRVGEGCVASHSKVKNREALAGRSRFSVEGSFSAVHQGSLPLVSNHHASFGRDHIRS